MKKLNQVDQAVKDEILAVAIERETPCVVTSRVGYGWCASKARFVTGGEAGRIRVVAASGATASVVAAGVVGTSGFPAWQRGEQVGLSFRRGHKKCMCATVVIGACDLAGNLPAGYELRWPDALQELQRRVYHRAMPPRRVNVRFWVGGVAQRAQADAGAGGGGGGGGIMSGMLLDLSAGGMRVRTDAVAPGRFEEGAPFGCSFTPKVRGEPIILDASFRHLQLEDDGRYSVGLQFVGLEASQRGRDTLAALANVVTDYQRGETRQRKLLAGVGAGI